MADSERTTNPNKTVVTVVSSSPARKETVRQACLVVIYGGDLGRRVPLGSDPTIIGRSSRCDVRIEQESVSRNQCRITFNGRGYTIRDLGSTNGTYVNDDLVDEIDLRDGDQLKVGGTILKFITGNNIEAQYHEEIYRLMTVDGLTGAHNRRYFQEMMEKEASRCERYDRVFSLVLLDIDHFKRINDSYGHLAGDSILRQIGALVQERVRRDDVMARVGGEEFGVILPEVDCEGATELAEDLRSMVEKASFVFEGSKIDVTISCGVAAWSSKFKTATELIKQTDEKLYEAKGAGRNQVRS